MFFEFLPVGEHVENGLLVVGVAVPVEAGSVVPCDSRAVRVGFAHECDLAEAGHGAGFAGH